MSGPINNISAFTINPSSFVGLPGSGFNVGDTLSAHVLDASNGSLILDIGGNQITAESTLPIMPGDLLELEYSGLTDGLMSLRLLDLNRQLAFSSLSAEDISSHLTNLGLPINDSMTNLLQSMTEFNVPLTRENIMQFNAALGETPNDFSMQAASFLNSAELPVTSENVQRLANFFEQKPEFGAYFSELQHYAALTSGAAGGKLAELLTTLPGVMAEYLLEPWKEAKEKSLERLQRLSQLAGIGGSSKKEQEEALSGLLDNLKNELGRTFQENHPLFVTLGNLEDLILGEYLLNADKRPGSFIYFQVPANFVGQNITAQVRIRCEHDAKGQRIVSPERGHIEFSVTTPSLGTVQCHLDTLGGKVAAKLFVDEDKEHFVESHIPLLKEAFQKINCPITRIEIAGKPAEFWPIQKENFESLERVSVTV